MRLARSEPLHAGTRKATRVSGLASLAAQTGRVTRRLVVFLGPRRQQIDGVEALPLDEFLALLPS